MSEDASLWPVRVRLSEVQRGARTLDLEADDRRRKILTPALDLVELKSLSASVRLSPWLDGVQGEGRWLAEVVQTCGLSLEDFSTSLRGEFVVRAVPATSAAAPDPEADLTVDPEAEEPPEVLTGEDVDVGGWVVEHLALGMDPFPRKPGAVFASPTEEKPPSPFAALKPLVSPEPDAD